MTLGKWSSKWLKRLITDAQPSTKLISTQTIRISSNGQNVQVESANGVKTFTRSSLPSKLQDKYCYAAYFVEAVRAKTPKVTHWGDTAKSTVGPIPDSKMLT